MRHYRVEFKQQILKEVKETGSITLVGRRHSVPNSTIHSWLSKNNNKELIIKGKENQSYRDKLSELELENQILKELLKKTHQVWLKG